MMEEEISNNSQNKESNYLHKLMEEYSFCWKNSQITMAMALKMKSEEF